MDKLSLAARKAKLAGVSYGVYMASIHVPVIAERKEEQILGKYEKKCCVCGTSFYTDNLHRKYCGEKCYLDSNRIKTLERYWRKRCDKED